MKKLLVFVICFFFFIIANANKANAMDMNTVVNLINNERAINGATPLTISDNLKYCADIRAQEIETNWSHTRPNGTDWFTVDDKSYGENLAKNFTTETALVTAWLESPTHKANILNSNFTEIYIAEFTSETGNYFACEFA